MTELPTDPGELPHGSEPELLAAFLDWYRAILIRKCEGLTDAEARSANCEPSILSLLGLVRHMADVERSWFRCWFEGVDAPPVFFTDDDPDGDLIPGEADTVAEAVAALRAEIEHADSLVAAASSLDQVSAGTSPGSPGWQPNLRWILVHLIEEYARHCGHADLLRERIDGATGD
jgi:uncharacterized damage-inducible protein DinB